MEETHIVGGEVHARRYDSDTGWVVEVAGNQPKATRQLLVTGATRRTGYDSVVADATTEQLIQFLATYSGYRVKLAKRVKRQYDEATKARMAERLKLARTQKQP